MATTWPAPCASNTSVKPPVLAPISSARHPQSPSPAKLVTAAASFNPARLTHRLPSDLTSITQFSAQLLAGLRVSAPSMLTAPAIIRSRARSRDTASPRATSNASSRWRFGVDDICWVGFGISTCRRVSGRVGGRVGAKVSMKLVTRLDGGAIVTLRRPCLPSPGIFCPTRLLCPDFADFADCPDCADCAECAECQPHQARHRPAGLPDYHGR